MIIIILCHSDGTIRFDRRSYHILQNAGGKKRNVTGYFKSVKFDD